MEATTGVEPVMIGLPVLSLLDLPSLGVDSIEDVSLRSPHTENGTAYRPFSRGLGIIEAILMGEEPSRLSLTKLTKVRSVIWTEQRRELSF